MGRGVQWPGKLEATTDTPLGSLRAALTDEGLIERLADANQSLMITALEASDDSGPSAASGADAAAPPLQLLHFPSFSRLTLDVADARGIPALVAFLEGAPAAAAGGPGLTVAQCGAQAFVLVCVHTKRDKKCGVIGPLVLAGFTKALASHGIENGGAVVVAGMSHIGGHKFAGTMIVYAHGQGHWYGRVTPCDVEEIMDAHVLGGKVVKRLWRGSMSPSTLSW